MLRGFEVEAASRDDHEWFLTAAEETIYDGKCPQCGRKGSGSRCKFCGNAMERQGSGGCPECGAEAEYGHAQYCSHAKPENGEPDFDSRSREAANVYHTKCRYCDPNGRRRRDCPDYKSGHAQGSFERDNAMSYDRDRTAQEAYRSGDFSGGVRPSEHYRQGFHDAWNGKGRKTSATTLMNCGARGHHADQCESSRPSPYPTEGRKHGGVEPIDDVYCEQCGEDTTPEADGYPLICGQCHEPYTCNHCGSESSLDEYGTCEDCGQDNTPSGIIASKTAKPTPAPRAQMPYRPNPRTLTCDQCGVKIEIPEGKSKSDAKADHNKKHSSLPSEPEREGTLDGSGNEYDPDCIYCANHWTHGPREHESQGFPRQAAGTDYFGDPDDDPVADDRLWNVNDPDDEIDEWPDTPASRMSDEYRKDPDLIDDVIDVVIQRGDDKKAFRLRAWDCTKCGESVPNTERGRNEHMRDVHPGDYPGGTNYTHEDRMRHDLGLDRYDPSLDKRRAGYAWPHDIYPDYRKSAPQEAGYCPDCDFYSETERKCPTCGRHLYNVQKRKAAVDAPPRPRPGSQDRYLDTINNFEECDECGSPDHWTHQCPMLHHASATDDEGPENNVDQYDMGDGEIKSRHRPARREPVQHAALYISPSSLFEVVPLTHHSFLTTSPRSASLSVMASKLTLAEIERGMKDERWGGYGYLGERRNATRSEQDRGDKFLLDEANKRGWDYDQLMAFMDSKMGRYFGDAVFGGHDDATVTRWINQQDRGGLFYQVPTPDEMDWDYDEHGNAIDKTAGTDEKTLCEYCHMPIYPCRDKTKGWTDAGANNRCWQAGGKYHTPMKQVESATRNRYMDDRCDYCDHTRRDHYHYPALGEHDCTKCDCQEYTDDQT